MRGTLAAYCGQETVRARMRAYELWTAPVLEYYDKRGLVRRVVVDGGTPTSVYAMVEPVMKETLARITA